MKGIVVIVFLLFFQNSSLSQHVSIIDSAGEPVPYATIEVAAKRVAVFAKQNGTVALPEGLEETDTLIISSIGFKTIQIAKKKVGKTVVLQRYTVELKEVLAYSGKWKSRNWGNKKKNYDQYGCALELHGPGEQAGRIIYPKDSVQGWIDIEKISFFYTGAGVTNAPVRLRIYELDENEMPGRDLLISTMVRNLPENFGWLDFDLTPEPVKMTERGVLVAVEYFSTDSQYWHKVKEIVLDDSVTTKGLQERNRLGGNFKTTNEAEVQGITLVRRQGAWMKAMDFDTPAKFAKLFSCRGNLVVRVWVRYPVQGHNN